MSQTTRTWVPCANGTRVSTCYHVPRCAPMHPGQRPGDAPFGRWSYAGFPSTPAEVTDEFLKGRVAEYRRTGFARSLLEYLGMSADEYAGWFLTGQVPARVARVWSSRAT